MKADITEQELLEGLANDDSDAIDYIYKENFKMVQHLILNNNGSYDDASDIFQEAMITLYEKSKDETFILTSKIRTYLYSVCRRLWLKRLQQMGRFSAPNELMEETIPVEEDLKAVEQRNFEFNLMEKSMNALGQPCKSLLEAFYIQKKDMVSIAEEFGYTNAENAKNQKYKCLVRLKKIFFAQYNTPEN